MKKILLTAIIAIFAISVASAQEKGQWAVGPKASFYSKGGASIFGIGAIGRYSFTDNWRIEPGLTALFKRGCSIEVNCDAQYVFGLGKGWAAYPLAGIAINDIGGWDVGMNIGAGADYQVARNWDISLNMKWQPIFTGSKSSFIVSFGGAYKF